MGLPRHECVAISFSRGSSWPRDQTSISVSCIGRWILYHWATWEAHVTSCEVKVAQSRLTLCKPMDYTIRGILQARILEWVAYPFSRGFSWPGNRIGLLHCRWSLPSEPPGKPKNTGVGSLSLLQGIYLTQELNLGLLHCRRIFYQLSYQGSPELHSCEWLNDEYYVMYILS